MEITKRKSRKKDGSGIIMIRTTAIEPNPSKVSRLRIKPPSTLGGPEVVAGIRAPIDY
jgi:hypothetical protein